VKIEKLGFYRTLNNQKVEVVAARNGYAVGFCDTNPLTWLDDGQHWNWGSGTNGSDQGLAIVAEWREPRSQTVTFALIERRGEHEVVWARNLGLSKVLATRTVTITEGEGMDGD